MGWERWSGLMVTSMKESGSLTGYLDRVTSLTTMVPTTRVDSSMGRGKERGLTCIRTETSTSVLSN